MRLLVERPAGCDGDVIDRAYTPDEVARRGVETAEGGAAQSAYTGRPIYKHRYFSIIPGERREERLLHITAYFNYAGRTVCVGFLPLGFDFTVAYPAIVFGVDICLVGHYIMGHIDDAAILGVEGQRLQVYLLVRHTAQGDF